MSLGALLGQGLQPEPITLPPPHRPRRAPADPAILSAMDGILSALTLVPCPRHAPYPSDP
jgi:hypothetical protein